MVNARAEPSQKKISRFAITVNYYLSLRAKSLNLYVIAVMKLYVVNHRRLFEPIGNVPPAEYEEVYYRSQEAPARVVGVT